MNLRNPIDRMIARAFWYGVIGGVLLCAIGACSMAIAKADTLQLDPLTSGSIVDCDTPQQSTFSLYFDAAAMSGVIGTASNVMLGAQGQVVGVANGGNWSVLNHCNGDGTASNGTQNIVNRLRGTTGTTQSWRNQGFMSGGGGLTTESQWIYYRTNGMSGNWSGYYKVYVGNAGAMTYVGGFDANGPFVNLRPPRKYRMEVDANGNEKPNGKMIDVGPAPARRPVGKLVPACLDANGNFFACSAN